MGRETLTNGKRIDGWVLSEADWQLQPMMGVDATSGTGADWQPAPLPLEERIATTTRYVASLYYVLNALENGFTTAERAFGVFAEMVRDVILGLVAGLMTTIVMSLSSADNEADAKLRRLQKWMVRMKLPKPFRVRCMQHFNVQWTTGALDLRSLME
jgi:hypothetical protein